MTPRPAARHLARHALIGSVAWLACSLAGAGATIAVAQTSTGGIRGFVKDETGGMLAGATVEATSPSRIGGPAVTVSDQQGLYRFENMPIGVYTISVSLDGFTPIRRENIRVETGRVMQLDLAMSVGTVIEAVTVTGDSPVVDATQAGYSTTLNQQLIDNVPTARGSYFDLVTYAPAVKTQPTTNAANFTIHGSGTNQNSFQYDGVEVSSVSGGGVWDFPAFEMAQEVEVKGIGASAEFAGFQGGVVNIVTKSGSNDLSGTGSYFFFNDTLTGNNQPNEALPYFVDYNHQATMSLGGPIKRDRLWVIGMVELFRRRAAQVGVDPEFVTPNYGARPFAKVTLRASQRDTIDVSYNDNLFHSPNDASRTSPFETIQVEHGHNPVITARWSRQIGQSSLLEVKGGGIYIRDRLDPTTDDFETPGHFDEGTGLSSVNARGLTRWVQNRTQAAVTLSRFASLWGSHDFKTGFQYSSAMANTSTATTGNLFFTDLDGAPSYAEFSDPATTIGRIRASGIFATDSWTPTPRLVLSLGVRADFIRGDVPEAKQLDATLRNETGETFSGIGDVISWNHVDPRVGLTLRLDGEGKTIAKASYGRYHGALITGMFANLSPGAAVTRQFLYNPTTRAYDLPGFVDNPRVSYAVDPELSNQYTDQVSVGVQHQLMSDLGIDISGVWKKDYDMIRVEDIRGTYVEQAFTESFRGQTQILTVFNRTSPSSQSLFQVKNRPELGQDYRALILQAYKRFSGGWQVQSSYSLQRARGWASGTQGIGGQGYSITGFGRDPNDLINAYGRLFGDSRHAVRLAATSQLPFGLHFGVRYSYDSGRPFARVVSVRGLQQGTRTVIAEPRGSYSLPALNDVQARVDKDLGLGGGRRLRLSVDVFNLLNKATFYSSRNNSSQGEATFNQPLSVISPRRATVGVRIEF